jgi:branched-chain amino acid transport system ATP-binding protein
MMLAIEKLSAGYGDVRVLREVTLGVEAGEILALLGRNGAGKTTLLKTVMGLVAASEGSIHFAGVDLLGLPAHKVPGLGIGYVPQGRRLFADLTVAENLDIAGFARRVDGAVRDRVLGLFPVLLERARQRAGSLSGGEQQILALARALLLKPKLLLIDEPTEGLMPKAVARIMETLNAARARGVGVILVEQRVDAALRIADRVAFLDGGRLATAVSAAEARRDASLIRRHVGVGG